ncbi:MULTISPECIES: hypothetical protein [Sphingobium]|uniref:hypothetical protein n=1 Tax=Sphingobium TaxID=165695 RepID=UPI00159C146D|nr:hypothetical protein [Sphingobium sp. 15-1]
MTTIHDDLPRPVPPIAQLRYKENFFFIITCPEVGVFGGMHFNTEPLFGRTKFHFDFLINGERVTYHNVAPISPSFGEEPFVSDGVATMTVHESHKLFTIVMKTQDLTLDLKFEGRFPTFDFHVCKFAAPELTSFRDVMSFGTNLPYDHTEQSMLVSGTVQRGGDDAIAVNGLGYRDHSWGMRGDNTVAWHTWSVINFPDYTIALMNQRALYRSGLEAKEGFIVDAAGARVLRKIEITAADYSAGNVLPDRLLLEGTDVLGQEYQLEADVAGRMGHVGLIPEVTNSSAPYSVTDNFCNVKDIKTGALGLGLIEFGFKPGWADPFK